MALHLIKHRIWKKLTAKKCTSVGRSNHNIDRLLIERYLNAPKPSKNTALSNSKLIAVDFETSGLKKDDQLISMGFCPLEDYKIRLRNCTHIVVNPEVPMSHDSVKIHGLTDDKVNSGVSAERALEIFLTLTENAVIIAHFHDIERQFIQNLAKKVLGKTIPLTFIDTFWIARQRMQRRNQTISPGSLRLYNLRQTFGLPAYNAHNALEDAIATAELFLAQIASMNIKPNAIQLRDLKRFDYHN